MAPAGIALVVALAMTTLVWLASLVKRDASIIDVFWGLGFVLVGWVYFAAADGQALRQSLVVGLVTLWGVRLSLHILWRNWGRGEDYRYREMREKNPEAFPLRSLLSVFWLQALLLWAISMPLYQVQRRAEPLALTPLDVLALALFLLGFVFEAGGDWQLARFKRDPGQPGPGDEPGPVALHPPPQLLRRRRRVVELLLLRGGDARRLVDALQPRADDAAADARLGRDAAREEARADQARLPRVRGAHERLLPLVARGPGEAGRRPVSARLCLVTGATGYVGGRLLRGARGAGRARPLPGARPESLRAARRRGTEVVRGDVLRPGVARGRDGGSRRRLLPDPLDGLGGRLRERGPARRARTSPRRPARPGVRRIIYLGGLGREPGLSRHLRSRQEVGRILRESGVPTLELRASIVIGSGSLSFEMVRAPGGDSCRS